MELFDFDIWTLLIVYSLLTLIIGIGFIILGNKYRSSFSGIELIGFSMVISAVGLSLNAMQLKFSPIVSILIANITIILGVYFLFFGIKRYLKTKSYFLFDIICVAIGITFLIIFFRFESVIGRVAIISVFTAFYAIRIAFNFFSSAKEFNKKVYKFLVILFTVLAFVNIYRIIDVWVFQPVNYVEGSINQALGIILLIVITMVMSISFFNLITNELNYVKGVFTSTLAHELRTPFNSIIGFSQLLAEENLINPLDEERYKKYINYSAHLGMQSLDNLLEWSKIRIGKISVTREELNLPSLFDEMLIVNQAFIEHKKIKVKKFFETEIIYADRQIISLIISNLVSNSVKFTPENGEIILYSNKDDLFYYFSVKNNGEPLSEYEIKMLNVNDLLESKIGTNSEKGSGLGLFIVKSLIEIHKGKLFIESDEIIGSEFKVQIPKNQVI